MIWILTYFAIGMIVGIKAALIFLKSQEEFYKNLSYGEIGVDDYVMSVGAFALTTLLWPAVFPLWLIVYLWTLDKVRREEIKRNTEGH